MFKYFILTTLLIITPLVWLVNSPSSKSVIEAVSEEGDTPPLFIIADMIIPELPQEIPQENQGLQEDIEMPQYDISLKDELQNYTYTKTLEHEMSYELALAVMKTESNFKINAVDYKNQTSRGLFQLNRNTWPWISQELKIENFDVFNPKHNIKAGIWYLDYLRSYWREKGYSDETVFSLTLMSYNRGISATKRFIIQNGISAVSQDDYVNKVYNYKIKLEMEEYY